MTVNWLRPTRVGAALGALALAVTLVTASATPTLARAGGGRSFHGGSFHGGGFRGGFHGGWGWRGGWGGVYAGCGPYYYLGCYGYPYGYAPYGYAPPVVVNPY